MTTQGATAGQRYCHATAIPKDGIADALALLSMPGSGAQAAGKGHPHHAHQVLELEVQPHLTAVQVLGTVMRNTERGQLPFQFRYPGAQGQHLIGRRDLHRNL